MQCKYCDYENQKDAIVCECCGATLATQKPLSYYKKAAKKRIKNNKKEKNKKIKKRRESVQKKPRLAEKKENKEKEAIAIEKKRPSFKTVILICTVYLVLFALAIGFFAFQNYTPRKQTKKETDRVITIYDPNSKSFHMLFAGRKSEGFAWENEPLLLESFDDGSALFAPSNSFDSFVYISKKEENINFSKPSHMTEPLEKKNVKFALFDGGKKILLLAKQDDGIGELYIYDAENGGEPMLYDSGVFDFVTLYEEENIGVLKMEGESIFFIDNSSSFKFDMGKKFIETIKVERIEDSNKFIITAETGKTASIQSFTALIYDLKEKKSNFSASKIAKIAISPNKETIAFTLYITQENKLQSYVIVDGKHHSVGSDIIVDAVSDDGNYVYATDKSGKNLYVTGKNKSPTLLGEGATVIDYTKDKKQVLIMFDSSLYISANGNYPVYIYGTCDAVSPLTSCEESFSGELLKITVSNVNYLCRLNRNYSLTTITNNIAASFLLNDGKSLLYRDSSGIVSLCKAGSEDGPKLIGKGSYTVLDLVAPNEKGIYSRDSNNIMYLSMNGKTQVISDSHIYRMPAFFKDALVFMELSTPPSLPTDSDGTSAVRGVYSLCYSKNGSKKELILYDIAKWEVTGEAIYIYKLNANASPDNPELFDVYGGTSLDDIKLLASGVYLVESGDTAPISAEITVRDIIHPD